MGRTDLTPEAYHQAVSILVAKLEEALERQNLAQYVYVRHETLGDTLYSYVTVTGSKPSEERIHKVLYFLSGFFNIGLGRGAGRHTDNRASFTLKRKIDNV
jgi:hypothetical protein